jgi:adenylate cyclase
LLPNIPVLDRAATGRGLFTIAPEADGVVRRVPMVLDVAGKLVPSLTLDILRVLTGTGAILIRTDATGILGLAVAGLQVPTDPHGRIWVHFNAHDPTRFVSAKDVVAGTADRSRIANKIALIGASAIGLLDNKTTPVSRSMPGVEVHAEVLESVLAGGLLHEPNFALAIEVLTALGIGLALIIVIPLLGPVFLLLIGTVLMGGIAAVSWLAYSRDGLLIDATYPLLSSFVVMLTLAFMNYVSAQIGRRRIRSAFGQYLSPDLVAELAKSPEKLVLGGETRVMSILFSDVRGFTGISESYKHDPRGLTTLMNRFLTPLTNAIIDHKGTIDKYMGDAIMAFWNAPLTVERHEHAACRASLDMLRRLETLNRTLADEMSTQGRATKPLDVGIGINTGACVVGNMGSDLRFDYSVLGDTVNLASRLEGQSKTYGVKIILGDDTAKAVKDAFAVIEIDLLQVKGKSQPTSVWALIGDGTILGTPEFKLFDAQHRHMLTSYRARDFIGAGILAQQLRVAGQRFGLQGLYDMYLDRIEAFTVAPPSEGWSGVYTATSK